MKISVLLPTAVGGLLWVSLAGGAVAPDVVPPSPVSSMGTGHSFAPVFSADGRTLGFVSQAPNLVSNGVPSRFLNIYSYQIDSGLATLVSTSGAGPDGGNEDSLHPTLSSNGQRVAFSTFATDLLSPRPNAQYGIYLRDLAAGRTEPVCQNTNGMVPNRVALYPSMSGDGLRVAFASRASDLVTNKINTGDNLYVRDFVADRTELVTVNYEGVESARRPTPTASSLAPTISRDGRYVLFSGDFTNVVDGYPQWWGVYVRDLETRTTVVATDDPRVFPTNTTSIGFERMSADGNAVVFAAGDFSLLADPIIFYFDRASQSTTVLATNGVWDAAAISANGRQVAFQSTSGFWLTDVPTMNQELVCGTNSLPGIQALRNPAISDDGQVVAFLGAPNEQGPWSVYAYRRTLATRELVSITTNGTPAAVLERSEPAISPDGRFVAFESADPGIIAGDWNNATDIFLRDLGNRTTTPVTIARRPSSTGPVGRVAPASPVALSTHARQIAFTDLTSSPIGAGEIAWHDLFLLDRVTGSRQIIRSAGSSGMRLAFSPVVSTDGRYVAWYEQPVPQPAGPGMTTNIHWLDRVSGNSQIIGAGGVTFPAPPPALSADGLRLAFAERTVGTAFTNVYVRSLLDPARTNTLISRRRLGTGEANGHSDAPLFTSDGQWVIFVSQATDLGPTTAGGRKLFARHLFTDELRWLSAPPTPPLFHFPTRALGAGDSRFVIFDTSDSFSRSIYRHDLLTTNPTVKLCADCAFSSVNASGRFVTYLQTNSAFRSQVWLKDMLSNETILVSANAGSGSPTNGNGNSHSVIVSSDGRYVVYVSGATNLVSDDTNGVSDVFVYDRVLRSNFLATRGSNGAPGNGPSTAPVLDPDGRTVVFHSIASNFTPGDFNNGRDLFVLRLGGPDTDFDGLDDQWEFNYFGNLERDGAGDWDGDGGRDVDEYRAGTDPTDGQSALRILPATHLLGNDRLIVWNSEPGRSYRVQFKQSLNDLVWQDASGPIIAIGITTTFVDSTASQAPLRFYRISQD